MSMLPDPSPMATRVKSRGLLYKGDTSMYYLNATNDLLFTGVVSLKSTKDRIPAHPH